VQSNLQADSDGLSWSEMHPAGHQIAHCQADSAEGHDGRAQRAEVVPKRRPASSDPRDDGDYQQQCGGYSDRLEKSPG
jgi:hypothetical protein